MERIIIFAVLSIPVIILSWKSLSKIKSHGFSRFFSWECILWLAVSSYKFWFDNPFGIKQIFAWILLIISGYLIIAGVIMMKKLGNQTKNRNEKELFQFEQTSVLIDSGIFKYIRHPLYSSLLFLTWGIFLKNTNVELFIISALSTIFLFLTAIFDEKECIKYFGEKYNNYMKKTKRFIPFIV